MNKATKLTGILIMLALATPVTAQYRVPRTLCDSAYRDTIVLPRFEPHLYLGTGFVGTNYGDNRLYYEVAPSFVFCPNNRWTVNAGFGITTDFGLNGGYNRVAAEPRSLAPYKMGNGGTRLFEASVAASYRISENVWVAGAIAHLQGQYAPYFGPANGQAVPVSATAISGAAAFRFANNDWLHIAFTYVRDHNGTMPYLYHDAWHNMGGYGYPFNNCGMGWGYWGDSRFGGWW